MCIAEFGFGGLDRAIKVKQVQSIAIQQDSKMFGEDRQQDL
jgi:hypothetical protein